MRRLTRTTITLATVAGMAVAASLVMAPAAFATPVALWVSPHTISSPGNSCAHPGFNSIQAAITGAPAGATINVCAGTYAEQLQITKSLSLVSQAGAVTVTLPATIANATTACDTAPGTGAYQADQDGVSICGHVTVKMTGIAVQAAWPSGTCYDSLYGILVAGGATLDFMHSALTAGGAVPVNGCQGGVGIQVGMAWVTTSSKVGHTVLSNDSVSGYQKNGVTIDGAGSTAAIMDTTVTGAGLTDTAQNGIQVSNGAKATISHSTIQGNECSTVLVPSCGLNGYQSIGVLFYGPHAGSSVTSSTIKGNDLGVYNVEDTATAPTASAVAINDNTLRSNRDESVYLDQGWATVDHDVIHGASTVGIELVQYSGQAYGTKGVALHDTISGMSVAAVQIASDRSPSDKRGSLVLEHSNISSNASPLVNNSLNFSVTQLGNT